MIFSTVNTLLVTVFQVGYYRDRRPQISHIHFILLWAAFLSCWLWPNSVSAVGLFIAALMVVPLCVVCAALWRPLRKLFPSRYWFVWPAIGVSLAFFVVRFEYFASYAAMPLLGALVLASTVASVAVAKLGELIMRRS
jgi:hypothetical protein